MLLSKMDSDDAGDGNIQEDRSHDYQTANEFVELMSRDHEFKYTSENLSTRDLVMLYKNIDVGSKVVANVNDFNQVRKPNQHVVTIIHNEDPESDDSELGEIYDTQERKNIFSANKERIEMLKNLPSYENILCQKLGDLEIQTSHFSIQYDKYFDFRDPFIKQQLNNLMSTENLLEEPFFPTSLLDYICCKRLEDNYNFYLDDIICYVKHTIEQLKRISNGDYLTDRAKEKWREVENIQKYENTKILATSTSIPLHVQKKPSGHISSWEDVIHSEVDVRSLSKILEKKIVLEIPKSICGTYKLFSKLCADNLIISCKRDEMKSDGQDSKSRVDVVLQLKRSGSGQVISNINSIMILQPSSTVQQDSDTSTPLPILYSKDKEEEKEVCTEKGVKIIEIVEHSDSIASNDCENCISKGKDDGPTESSCTFESIAFACNENKENLSCKRLSYQEPNRVCDTLHGILDKKESLIIKTLDMSPDELQITIKKCNITSLPEEYSENGSHRKNEPICKSKSPTRFRIKSPYHNKSYALEEKKRKKLLEIRERRERKKMAMGEKCKDYGRHATMPQSANSVTKLSITNKSFYNSIYGQNRDLETKSFKRKPGCVKKEIIPEISLNDSDDEYKRSIDTPDKHNKKYINKSFYLDETETEMMFLKCKQQNNTTSKDLESVSTSAVSNDFKSNLTLLSQLIGPSESDLSSNTDVNSTLMTKNLLDMEENIKSHSLLEVNIVSANSPKDRQSSDNKHTKKITSASECRESIKQIYDLMKQSIKNNLHNANRFEEENLTSKNENSVIIAASGCTTIQDSDSGTSLKHYQTSSVPSCFSLDKSNAEGTPHKINPNKKPERSTMVVPKVIIHSRLQSPTPDKVKKEKHVSINPPIKLPENPLRAISQILHKFENVQKVRQKPIEPKIPKNSPTLNTTSGSGQNPFSQRSKVDQNEDANVGRLNSLTPRRRNHRTIQLNTTKIPRYQNNVEDKPGKIYQNKLADIMDQAKEARGEAVRGPSKLPSRLNSLAQPKRTYVQAHSEEYRTKYGKSVMTNRLQKLATNSFSSERPLSSTSSKNRYKRSDTTSVAKQPPSIVHPPVTHSIHKTAESPMVPSCKLKVPNSPENLTRMVSMNSPVNNLHGRAFSGGSMPRALKSRVPLFPINIEHLATEASKNCREESTVLGSKLHRIIDSIIEAKSGLAAVAEGAESNLNISSNNTEKSMNNDRMSKEDGHISIDSDFHLDTFRDENANMADNELQNLKTNEINLIKVKNIKKYNEQPANSFTELHKLENALYRTLSVGTFPKRLRIKNLTLTPRQSIEQVFAQQSGDGNTIVGRNVALKKNQVSRNESLCGAKSLTVLSQSCIDWRLASIPMQITTVTCSFPNYEKITTPNSKIISLDDLTVDVVNNNRFPINNKTSNEILQYTSGCTKTVKKEQIVQVDLLKGEYFSYMNDIETINNPNVEIKSLEILSHDFITQSSEIVKYTKEVKDGATNTKPDEQVGDIDYTTSFDILVGLLNEIQKITSCQSQITNTNNENLQSKDLETMLNNSTALITSTVECAISPGSVPSVDKLKQMKSSSSVYNNELFTHENIGEIIQTPDKNQTVNKFTPLTIDKEVYVVFSDRQYVNSFTNVPSEFFPVTLNHSTNVTNSLIGILSEPSTESIFSLNEFQLNTGSSSESRQIIPKPNLQKPEESQHLIVPQNEMKKEEFNQNSSMKLLAPIDISKKVITQKYVLNYNQPSMLNECYKSEEFDETLKMKRDILVTFYSILVLTVFAALSFPEIMYHV